MDNQQRVKDAAEKPGGENVVVILGSSDPEGAEIYAETVTLGTPPTPPLGWSPVGTLRVPCSGARTEAGSRSRQVGSADQHDGNGS